MSNIHSRTKSRVIGRYEGEILEQILHYLRPSRKRNPRVFKFRIAFADRKENA